MSGYIEKIKERARADVKTIVMPETNDKRIIIAAAHIIEEGIANIILVGNKEKIMDGAGWLEVDLSKVQIVEPSSTDKLDEYVDLLYETRKSKGMTPEKAREMLLTDPLVFGVMMVKANDADGMVVSGFFILDVPNSPFGNNGTFLFADCGLNQDPTSEELAHIAYSSSKSFKNLVGGKPIIAMLSHSTKGSAKHPLVDKVTKAVEYAHEFYPNLTLDGELQTDAAIVPAVAKNKAPGSEVAGKANVLIFPNLDAGNIGYKLVERLGGADAYGPMLQGIARPVNDLSRGCSWEDIVGVVALTAVQAQLV